MGNRIVISKGQSVACPYNLFRCSLIYKNKPLSYTRARVCIISRLKEVIFSSNIDLHCLRSGGAAVAANSNGNERCWKRHGRWKSDSAKDCYIADSLEHRLDVTKLLGL